MLVILEAGGFQGGGINFDAKLRRNSTDIEDLFYAHIGGIDAFARALLTADKILQNSAYLSMRKERYASFDSGDGKMFEEGKLDLTDLYQIAQDSNIKTRSGQQEFFENIINQYL
jgi:xylose isomerase